MTFMLAIETSQLTKKFGELVAVNKVSLSIEEGELFGLLGPNGAGKTTFISMLYTMLKPTSGSARVCGCDVVDKPDAVRRAVGVVFQDPSLDSQLTGRENLDFHARMYGMNVAQREKRIREVLALVELEEKAGIPVKNYSGGMRRRLELARGLMHSPKVLFLDEPTIGLDPQTRRRIWEYVEQLNREQGTTIILTTHYMEEADFLCRRVAIIDGGEIIALDAPNRLKSVLGGDVILAASSSPEQLLDLLKREAWVKGAKLVNDTISLSVGDGEALIPKLMKIAGENGIKVNSVGLRKPTLEDVFIHYTGRAIREEQGGYKDAIRSKLRARVSK